MSRLIRLLFLLSFSFAFVSSYAAPQIVPAVPHIAAKGYILLDYHSGYVLAKNNADERMAPASLTKLMTAYAVFHELEQGRIKLSDKVRVSEKAWRTPGSRMFIEVGSQVPVEQLLKGLIIQSGNDAAVALAEYVAGSEDAFVALMNEYAHDLGLKNTHFANATGLPHPNHYSTAHDLARLGAALIREFPQYYPWYSIKKFTYNNITQNNRNLLLWRDDGVDGMKTGHTESAGYCLVSSAKRGEMRLVAAVMGTASEKARARESEKLLGYGFRFFETHQLYAADKPLKTMRIWKGETDSLALGLKKPLYVTVPRGRYDNLNASLTVDNSIVAPVRKGQQFGTVNVRLGNDTLAKRPLVALQQVPEGGLWQRTVDSVLLLFQ